MGNLFDREATKAVVRPKITDQTGLSHFTSAIDSIVDPTTANTISSEADAKRLGSFADQHKAAYLYLALAFRLIETPSLMATSSGKMFHFAGHAFREIGQLNRAADAYWRAGVMSTENGVPVNFGIRSLVRAKSGYAEIGETNRSDEMHVLEWEARRLRSKGLSPILYAWKITSRYGTSTAAWFVSVTLFILGYAFLYEWLHFHGLLYDAQTWTPYGTAVYYSVVTSATVGYGDIVPCHWASQLAVILNVLLAYVLLAVGATVLGRKVLGR